MLGQQLNALEFVTQASGPLSTTVATEHYTNKFGKCGAPEDREAEAGNSFMIDTTCESKSLRELTTPLTLVVRPLAIILFSDTTLVTLPRQTFCNFPCIL